jgi:hypothetical protein
LKHPYFKVSQDFTASTAHLTTANDSSANSAKSHDSKQIFADDWETDAVRKITNYSKDFLPRVNEFHVQKPYYHLLILYKKIVSFVREKVQPVPMICMI